MIFFKVYGTFQREFSMPERIKFPLQVASIFQLQYIAHSFARQPRDQMGLRKIRLQYGPTHFLSKLMHNFNRVKKKPKM
jgi:hypothetical protein